MSSIFELCKQVKNLKFLTPAITWDHDRPHATTVIQRAFGIAAGMKRSLMKKKRIGLALGGGGAKGLCHILRMRYPSGLRSDYRFYNAKPRRHGCPAP
jgi:hypothetical protein